jgi:hypothetical protein
MKKIIATAIAGLMLCGVSTGVTTPADAASYSVHITSGTSMHHHHGKHWRQHLVCKTKWRHHHKIKVCIWVPNKHHY